MGVCAFLWINSATTFELKKKQSAKKYYWSIIDMKLMSLFERSDNEKRDTIDDDDVVVITVEKKVLMAISLWNKKVIKL